LTVLLLALAPAWATSTPQLAPLRADLTEPVLRGAIGGKATLRLRLELPPGWHTYPPVIQRNAEGEGPYPLQVSVESPSPIRMEGAPLAAPQ